MNHPSRWLVVFFVASVVNLLAEDGDWSFYEKCYQEDAKVLSASFRRKLDDEKTSTFRYFPEFLKRTLNKPTISVFEGLPQQQFEADLLKRELKGKETVKVGGFPFYAALQTPDEEASAGLLLLLRDLKHLRPQRVSPMCGGFHPDYLLRVESAGERTDILLCFGCGEARIVFGERVVHCTLVEQKDFEEHLKEFANQRPTKG